MDGWMEEKIKREEDRPVVVTQLVLPAAAAVPLILLLPDPRQCLLSHCTPTYMAIRFIAHSEGKAKRQNIEF